MREILFRGKSIYTDSFNTPGFWLEGSLVYNTITFEDSITNICHIIKRGEYLDICLDDDNEVWPQTIGQFTYLIDKNGVKIFEGDICDLSIIGGDHKLVKFDIRHGCVGYEPLFYNEVHPDDRKWRCVYDNEEDEVYNVSKYFTIIGNIHDNPELLNK